MKALKNHLLIQINNPTPTKINNIIIPNNINIENNASPTATIIHNNSNLPLLPNDKVIISYLIIANYNIINNNHHFNQQLPKPHNNIYSAHHSQILAKINDDNSYSALSDWNLLQDIPTNEHLLLQDLTTQKTSPNQNTTEQHNNNSQHKLILPNNPPNSKAKIISSNSIPLNTIALFNPKFKSYYFINNKPIIII